LFKKPKKLNKGDCIATISLSGGSAGESDIHWRYEIAKNRLKKEFELEVIETPNSQKGREYIYKNPRARADDFMEALQNPNIKGIILNHGGDEGIRILPYIDFNIIEQNPKVFMGYSDGSTFLSMFYKAEVVSFYGPCVFNFSERTFNHYSMKWIKKVLFSSDIIGTIEPAPMWTSEQIDWNNGNAEDRKLIPSTGYEILQGSGKVVGQIIGGCSGPMQLMKGTELFPKSEDWENGIIFYEGVIPYDIELAGIHTLRSFAATGMFRKAKGVIFSRPNSLNEECKRVILKVIREEEGLTDLPILFNLDCGHTWPMTVLPIGVNAEIDCEKKTLTILESGVE
jgi:muramoyltetrapeptide carboxypeptidase LdcA involved in peptidoglycan recycling